MIQLDHNFMMFWVFILSIANTTILCVTLAYLTYFSKHEKHKRKHKKKKTKQTIHPKTAQTKRKIIKEETIRRTPEYEG